MKRISFALVMLAAVAYLSAQEVEKQPVVDWGVKLQANSSNYLFKNVPTMPALSSDMNAGAEVGGFMDFNITQRFYIQFNLIGTFEQCFLDFGDHTSKLQSSALEIPVFALWRFGNSKHGWLCLGGGPYTEFIVWGSLEGMNPFRHVITDNTTGQQTIVTADNHSGLAAFIGYEFPCGLQLNATYHFGISDMLLFEHDSRDTYQRPQKLTLGLGWRF